MSTKWLIGFLMLFVISTVVSLMLEAQQFGADEGAILYTLLSPDMPAFSNPIGAVVAALTVTWDYIQALWSILSFDYSFFEGSWQLVRYMLFLPITVGMAVSMVLAVVRGVSSG